MSLLLELVKAVQSGDITAAQPLIDHLKDIGDDRSRTVNRLVGDLVLRTSQTVDEFRKGIETGNSAKNYISMLVEEFKEEMQILFWIELTTQEQLKQAADWIQSSV